MTAPLTHEQAAEEIEAVALGIAPEDLSQGVVAHAAGCPECAAELRSFYRVVASLSALIPERTLNRGHSAGIKSRLFARTGGKDAAPPRRPARAELLRSSDPRAPAARPSRVEPEPARERLDRSSMPIWIAVVATVIALGSIAAMLNARGERDALAGGGTTEPVVDESRVAELERAVAQRDTTIASVTGPGVRIISLYNREAREPLARMFWDRRSDRWTLFVYSLRQPRPGRVFQVWLGTDDGRVALGTFQPRADGTGTFSAEHRLALAALNTVSISGAPRPAPPDPWATGRPHPRPPH
ncbi:MAG: anti-sigma factor [Gemmatimonadaceae bacterium]|nr:anti-sigma factor [Gemmatimonadaceae bacterium]